MLVVADPNPSMRVVRLTFDCGCWLPCSVEFIEDLDRGKGPFSREQLFMLLEQQHVHEGAPRQLQAIFQKRGDLHCVTLCSYETPRHSPAFDLLYARMARDTAGEERTCGACGLEFPKDQPITFMLDGTVRCEGCGKKP